MPNQGAKIQAAEGASRMGRVKRKPTPATKHNKQQQH
jgi:hypothetical protein